MSNESEYNTQQKINLITYMFRFTHRSAVAMVNISSHMSTPRI